ncbi:MAG: SdpI family protein [Angelakisella sp.]
MGFWIFMFCCTLLIPIIMIIAGNSMRLGKFKTINSIVGYRTRRSMKNQQTWDYAHRECGLLWRRWGSTMLVLTVIAMLLFMGEDTDHIGVVRRYYRVADDPLFLSIVIVEKKLREKFDENGLPR